MIISVLIYLDMPCVQPCAKPYIHVVYIVELGVTRSIMEVDLSCWTNIYSIDK